jgi:hypothetical protein
MKQLLDTSGDSSHREKIFSLLKKEMEAHAIAEERVLYRPMLEYEISQEKARHSIAEHKELDDFLKDLVNTDMSSSGWLTTCKELKHRLDHHLEEEEQEFFQIAGKVLKDKTKKDEEEFDSIKFEALEAYA